MIKTSWAKLIQASRVADAYLTKHPEKTKLEYAIQRTLSRIAKTNDGLQEQLETIDIDHASTDKDGILLTGPNGYQFTPEKKKARNAKRTALIKAVDVEIDPYFASEIPDDISEADLDAFEGIIIRTADVERIRAMREDEPEKGRTAEAS